jgi:N4-gp56 family major capsid protein
MAVTNFGKLTDEQKTVWAMEFWKQAREQAFITRFLGTGPNSLIQHITELKKTEKGTRAVITLLADLEGDGVVGDRTLEGNEESPKAYDKVITVDQMRNGEKLEGRMADQASVVNFRENARDTLAYWAANRLDQLAFLTLAGRSYAYHTDGRLRIGSDLINLDFAADLKAPSAKRVGRWDSAAKEFIVGDGQNTVTAADTPTWELFVQLHAYAQENHIRGVNRGGEETYHAFLSPTAMSRLKLDPTYLQNLRHATSKGANEKLFSGGSVNIDGIVLHTFRHVPNTRLAQIGSKFGASGDVDGCQILFCGAQALAFAQIGKPGWDEVPFDYNAQPGIAIHQIIGFLKPQFPTQYSGGSEEDHGVISAYVAQ